MKTQISIPDPVPKSLLFPNHILLPENSIVLGISLAVKGTYDKNYISQGNYKSLYCIGRVFDQDVLICECNAFNIEHYCEECSTESHYFEDIDYLVPLQIKKEWQFFVSVQNKHEDKLPYAYLNYNSILKTGMMINLKDMKNFIDKFNEGE